MASEVTHCGEAGAGQAVKILNNMILFQTGVALAEALSIARANGIDGKILFETLTKGSADSFALRNHGMKAMLPGVFPERAFSTDYALKDLSYAIADGRGAGRAGARRRRRARADGAGHGAGLRQGILAGPAQGDRGRHEEVAFAGDSDRSVRPVAAAAHAVVSEPAACGVGAGSAVEALVSWRIAER